MSDIWELEERFEELGFFIRMKRINEACVDFQIIQLDLHDDGNGSPYKFRARVGNTRDVTNDIEKAEVFADGFIKFDHCAEIKIGSFHVCDQKELVNLGLVLGKLHDLVGGLIEMM